MDLTKEFKDQESFIHWFIIAAVCGTEITEAMKSEPRNITMQLNGEEIDPKRALLRLEEEFDRCVDKKAEEKIADIKRDILNPFEDEIERLTDTIDEMIAEKTFHLNEVSRKGYLK